jgi:hypothetical protein
MSLPESDLDAFKAFEKAGWERAADLSPALGQPVSTIGGGDG